MGTTFIGVIALILLAWIISSFVITPRPTWHWSKQIAEHVKESAAGAIGWAGLCLVVVGVGVIGYQCLLWLRQGYWTPLELRLGWAWLGGGEPFFPRWQGVEKIAVWILDQPLALGLIVGGVAIAILGATKAESIRIARRRAKATPV